MKTVLVVDDNEFLCRVTRDILETEGYRAFAAFDAAQALEAFERENFDLVVTDLRMPGMTGLELARAIRDKNPGFPVIMMTAYGPIEADEIRACLGKENLFPELLEMIRLCLAEAEEQSVASGERT